MIIFVKEWGVKNGQSQQDIPVAGNILKGKNHDNYPIQLTFKHDSAC